jgi:hypothetical protein
MFSTSTISNRPEIVQNILFYWQGIYRSLFKKIEVFRIERMISDNRIKVRPPWAHRRLKNPTVGPPQANNPTVGPRWDDPSPVGPRWGDPSHGGILSPRWAHGGIISLRWAHLRPLTCNRVVY